VYPAPEVTALIDEELIPVRIHIKEQPRMWHRFRIRWTPTVMILASDGFELRRTEGFLPTEDFLGRLQLGLCYAAADRKDWPTAERWFTEASGQSDADAAAEGLYFVGVARYSAGHDPKELADTYRAFQTRYEHTSWAKRASIWAPKA